MFITKHDAILFFSFGEHNIRWILFANDREKGNFLLRIGPFKWVIGQRSTATLLTDLKHELEGSQLMLCDIKKAIILLIKGLDWIEA